MHKMEKGGGETPAGVKCFSIHFLCHPAGAPEGLGNIHSLIEIVSSSYDLGMTHFPKKKTKK